MKKASEKISHSMAVAPELVWEIIGSVGGVDKWFGSMIKTCHVDGDKRFCETTNGVQLEEHILEVNHDTRTFRFGIPHQELLPVENIVETMQVKPGDNGNALVEWSASFEGSDQSIALARKAFRQLWHQGLSEMEAYIGTSIIENQKTNRQHSAL